VPQERAAGYKNKDFIEAKKDFVFEMLKWSGAMTAQPKKILDCGCGIGGTSRLLAKAFPDAEIVGITLSPSQVPSPTPLFSSPLPSLWPASLRRSSSFSDEGRAAHTPAKDHPRAPVLVVTTTLHAACESNRVFILHASNPCPCRAVPRSIVAPAEAQPSPSTPLFSLRLNADRDATRSGSVRWQLCHTGGARSPVSRVH
jgi:hypothetical protein